MSTSSEEILWDVWMIDPVRSEETGKKVQVGKRHTYKASTSYWAKKAYWNEHLAKVAEPRDVSFNAFVRNLGSERQGDRRFGRGKPDLEGFVTDIRQLISKEV